MPRIATNFRVHDRKAFPPVHESVAINSHLPRASVADRGELGRREIDAVKASRLSAAIEARQGAENAAVGREREASRDLPTQAARPSGALPCARARERAA
jgi:hypothetical protein